MSLLVQEERSSVSSDPPVVLDGLGADWPAPGVSKSVAAASDPARLQADLLQLARGGGFHGAFYVHIGHAIPTGYPDRGPSPIRFVASFPGARLWYLGEDGEVVDPAARRAMEGGLPFVWNLSSMAGETLGERKLQDNFRRRGMLSGLCVPVADYVAGPAYLSFCSAYRIAADDPEVREQIPGLAYAAQQFHILAKAALNPALRTGPGGSLTPREIACLRLGALGRTVAESAQALNVAPRTIEFHLKNAAEKFGAPNKLRAILLAVSAGLIEV